MTHQNTALCIVALMALAVLMGIWSLTAHGPRRTRHVREQMLWSDKPPDSPKPWVAAAERHLAPLPEGAVRLTYVSAPDHHVVVKAPGLITYLREVAKKQISVEFEVACGLRGGGPRGLNISAIEIRRLDNVAPITIWAENMTVGARANPIASLGGVCNWW